MTIKKNYANKKNYGGKRNTSIIKYIVIHYTANDGDSDESNAKYFKEHIIEASANYFVDDDSITQSVPDNYIAYSVGGAKYTNTKGASLYNVCTNSNSISIELCDSVKNGKYDFTENTLKQAVELVNTLSNKYKIPYSNIIRHYDVTGKICPKPFVDNNKEWKQFKNRLKRRVNTNSSKLDIMKLQRALNNINCGLAKLKEDGDYGRKTSQYMLKVWSNWGWNKLKRFDGYNVGEDTIKKLGMSL
jgi:N-acetylmuramoyl-L-alanine amidase